MDAQVKTQVIERIRQANNILVTVSSNPSIDQLASCVGLTLLLSKMDKHATAVFSGKVPPMLKFLEPEKTIEPNTDSLRDFIISLDKNKADKLRYKVEDQVVKIFITPYKTSLSENDLEYSQGDFNVEVVLALGVKDKAHIDTAITAHGRILHDATVISVNTGAEKSVDVGQINWQDPAASSLAEMIVTISEAFGSGLIDSQMANAFLTGIVAETERFKNTKTNPKVMTIAAQLMAAGANQQLIVSKLEPPTPPPLVPAIPAGTPGGPPVLTRPLEEGTLNVSHKSSLSDSPEVEVDAKEIRIDEQGNLKSASGQPKPAASEAEKGDSPKVDSALPEKKAASDQPPDTRDKSEEKLPGPHSFLDSKGSGPSFSSATGVAEDDTETPIDPLAEPKDRSGGFLGHGPTINPSQSATDNKPGSPAVDNARSAVESALTGTPFDPASNPIAALNAQPLSGELHQETDDGSDVDKDRIAPPAPPPVPPPITLDSSLLEPKNDKKD
jgi:hypothetical protein